MTGTTYHRNKGKCRYCGKRINGEFCNEEHEAKYRSRTNALNERNKAKRAEKRCKQKQAEWINPLAGMTPKQRLDAIAQRAAEQHTLGWAQLAPTA